MKIRTEKIIHTDDWDSLVSSTYGRPYNFQQQDGCKERGLFYITIPDHPDDFENDTVPENVNDAEMGVSFKAWLERDTRQKLTNPRDQSDNDIIMWWERNFYPDVQMVANDLHEKGLIEAGEYVIEIDW